MTGKVIPKLEQVLEKLENLERYVKAVDEEVSNLQAKVDCFQKQNRKKDQRAGRRIGFCEHGMRSFKEKFDKLKCEINPFRDEKLYMEVYQRRENLRFFGIKD